MHKTAKGLLPVIVMGVALLIGPLALAAEGAPHAPHWSYSGATGPDQWGTLEKDYSSCGLGKTQSPIDIHSSEASPADLPAIHFDYKRSTLKLIDNGHSIQINYAPGSFIDVGGQRYELVQFHFHHPSEEQINGKSYDMVAHLVHRNSDGKLAVVAVLLKQGAVNPLIKTLWAHLPHEKNKEVVVDAVKINAAELLPQDRGYYTFAGSLTTPPCSEDVTWFVLRTPSSISATELKHFASIYPMNARPVQALNGREVKASR
jgi:carbonic anhydrase